MARRRQALRRRQGRHVLARDRRALRAAARGGGDRPRRERLAARGRRAERAADVRRPRRSGRKRRHRRAERPQCRHLRGRPARAALQGMGRGRQEVQDHRSGAGADAPVRRRPPRPRCPRQGREGLRDLDPRRRLGRAARDPDRHRARRTLGLLRRQGRRLARVGLQRLHRDPRDPADLRVRRRVRARHRPGRPHPRAGRLDRHLPADPRRVHQARRPRLRPLGGGDRRHTPSRACSATSCPT